MSSKGKRKIIVNQIIYYWYVKWDNDWYFENIIYILNEERQHEFSYIVGKDETRIFGKSIKSPVWINSNGLNNPNQVSNITPRIVSEIISWCIENKKNEQ